MIPAIVAILSIVDFVLLVVMMKKVWGSSGEVADVDKLLEKSQERFSRLLKEEMQLNRREVSTSLKDNSDSLDRRLAGVAANQAKEIARLVDVVEKKLTRIQLDNTTQLEKMRQTVDEKLQSTLEKRLGESFKHVSQQLEQVYKGLGEMQHLASGVGDLKKVLANVKTRGTWGEIQLDNLLSQILVKEQYEKNVAVVPRSSERVEFAIKIPSKDADNTVVWLPIDAKFPLEDYHRLVEAQEAGDIEAIKTSSKNIEARIKQEAKTINDKYISPPHTTDFALLYIPIEGLYAEVVQRPGLTDSIQSQYKVVVAGPQSVAAMLNAFQVGFRTLAIEKRTSEIWAVLGSVKTEFGKFGDMLEKTKQKLEQATKTIDEASTKTRTIGRQLDKVQILEPGKSQTNLLEK
ncbi:MAG TPA: DNA recombination protein RmuC [Candidatus Saccharimonadales bacterium]|nr:DNA recombination protein RmuC [Candidatus Saccharimonadales bacterium]